MGIYLAGTSGCAISSEHAAAIDPCWYFKFWVRGALSGFHAQLLSLHAHSLAFRAPLCSRARQSQGLLGWKINFRDPRAESTITASSTAGDIKGTCKWKSVHFKLYQAHADQSFLTSYITENTLYFINFCNRFIWQNSQLLTPPQTINQNCSVPCWHPISDAVTLKTIGIIEAMANLSPAYQLPLSQWEPETLAARLITDTVVLFEKLLIWQMLMLSDT